MQFLDYSIKDDSATIKISTKEVAEIQRILNIIFAEYQACAPILAPGLICVDRPRLYELETDLLSILMEIGHTKQSG